jgi:hypothetical protein
MSHLSAKQHITGTTRVITPEPVRRFIDLLKLHTKIEGNCFQPSAVGQSQRQWSLLD